MVLQGLVENFYELNNEFRKEKKMKELETLWYAKEALSVILRINIMHLVFNGGNLALNDSVQINMQSHFKHIGHDTINMHHKTLYIVNSEKDKEIFSLYEIEGKENEIQKCMHAEDLPYEKARDILNNKKEEVIPVIEKPKQIEVGLAIIAYYGFEDKKEVFAGIIQLFIESKEPLYHSKYHDIILGKEWKKKSNPDKLEIIYQPPNAIFGNITKVKSDIYYLTIIFFQYIFDLSEETIYTLMFKHCRKYDEKFHHQKFCECFMKIVNCYHKELTGLMKYISDAQYLKQATLETFKKDVVASLDLLINNVKNLKEQYDEEGKCQLFDEKDHILYSSFKEKFLHQEEVKEFVTKMELFDDASSTPEQNILTIKGWNPINTEVYIKTEPIYGSLDDFILSPISLPVIRLWCTEIVNQLSGLCKINVCFGGIKPSDIFLTQGLIPKFGPIKRDMLAFKVTGTKGLEIIRKDDFIAYVTPPEFTSDIIVFNIASLQVYFLGAIICQLLTKTSRLSLKKILKNDIKSQSFKELMLKNSKELLIEDEEDFNILVEAMLKCLEPDPSKRISLDDLKKLLNPQP